jgi:iron(III) transport system substrate-binding protein
MQSLSRRDAIRGVAAAAVGGAVLQPAQRGWAAAPEPQKVTAELIAAARKEGTVSFYTSVELPVAERVAKAFEAKFPGISVRVERSGAERNFQRIAQEYASKIYACDITQSSDAAHFISWKRDGLLASYLSVEVANHYPPQHKDADGMFASWRIYLSVIAYNTRLVKPEDAPRSFADLLDAKWVGKLVKAHPGYSGTIMTATQQMVATLGWGYFEKLAKQKVMQLQSAADPPKKVAVGERAIQVDGADYTILQFQEKGEPVEIVYASEGTPLISGPAAIMARAPNPNAARLFYSWAMGIECQQLNSDTAGLRSAHALVAERKGRKPLAEIKLMQEDPVAVEAQSDQIKAKYTAIFGV